MKKILMVIHVPDYGGLHAMALNLSRALQRRGWEPIVAAPAGSGHDRLVAAGIRVEKIPLSRLRVNLWRNIAFALRFGREVELVRKLIRELDIDFIQAYGLTQLQSPIAGRQTGVPVVWQLHSTYPPPVLRRLLSPVVTRVADIVMTTGRQVAHAHPGIAELGQRLHPFFAPVDTRLFQPDPVKRQQARAQLGVPDDALLIGTIGVRTRQKAHEYLVQAARDLMARHDNVHFRILGASVQSNASYYRDTVESLVEKYDLRRDGRFEIVDPGDQVPTLIQAFDIFTLSSIAEGAPTVAMEAMSCGIPVVATDVGSTRELVGGTEYGLIVQPRDPGQLAAALEDLVRDAERRSQMGANCRRRAIEVFDVEACADIHERAYEAAARYHSKRSVT